MKDKEFSLDHLGHLTFILKLGKEEFPCGTVNYGSGVITAVTWVIFVADLIPGMGNSTCHRHGQNIKKSICVYNVSI